MPEQIAGKYTLLNKLATGGMAEIFLAEQTGPGGFKKRLVIKQILEHLVDDAKFLQMFQDEARVAAMMNHPNIVQIFELGLENERYYIAMEYVPGFNLREVIKLSSRHSLWLAPEYIAKLGSQICEGLEYAHNFCDSDNRALNIIHRDISPQNIILSRQGMIKIVDFGIAKASSNEQKTQAGVIKGKLAYMSPEQVRGITLDRRSDLFSLGIVLYEMATHSRPFHGNNDLEMLRSVLDAAPAPIDAIRPDFPPELTRIIHRALVKDREQRYSSAAEMQWDLERFIQAWGRPISPFQLRELVQHLDQFDEEQKRSTPTGGLPGVAENKEEQAPRTEATPSEQRQAVMAGASSSTTADATAQPMNEPAPAWPSQPPAVNAQLSQPPAVPGPPPMPPTVDMNPSPTQPGLPRPPAIPPMATPLAAPAVEGPLPPSSPPRPSFDPDAWDDGEATIMQVPSGIDMLKEALKAQAALTEDSGARAVNRADEFDDALSVPTMLDNISLPEAMVQEYMKKFHNNPVLDNDLDNTPPKVAETMPIPPGISPPTATLREQKKTGSLLDPPVESTPQKAEKKNKPKKKTPTWMKVALGIFVGSTVLAGLVLILIQFLYRK